jgi:hypothetical protein
MASGVAAWNAGRYSEAADRFEEVWAGEVGQRRACLRGVIHAAMGLHYLGVGDLGRARAKLVTAARLLEPLPDVMCDLDLHDLRTGLTPICACLEPSHTESRVPATVPEGSRHRVIRLKTVEGFGHA